MKHPTSFLVPAVPNLSWSKRTCALLLACSTLGACGGDDDGDDTPVGPEGPVELSITGFLNNQGQSFERDADAVVLSCDGTINVRFGPVSGASLENWLLRPPGACESMKQCGYILLEITPEAGGTSRNVAGANIVVLAPASPGSHRLDAKLLNGEGETFLQEGEPVDDSLSGVDFQAPVDCEPSNTGSGGSGGSSTTGGAAGAGALTGAGGAAGDGGAAGQAGDGGAAGAAQG